MSNDPEGANALDIEQAVAKLAARRTNDTTPAEAEADPEPEDNEGAPEEAEEGADGQDDADDDNPPVEQEEPALEVELPDGKRKLTAAEIRDGLMLKADYTRKTMELADQRRAIQAMEAETARLREQLSESLQQWAVPTEAEPDWDALAAKNPTEAFKAKLAWDKRQATARQAAEQYRILQAQENQRRATVAYTKLVEVYPEWRSPEALERDFSEMTAAAKDYGFEPSEVLSLTDDRMIRLLKELTAWHKVKAAKPEVQKKVASAPVTLKPGAKPARSDTEAAVQVKQIKAKLKASGSVNDAVALLQARRNSKG